jgi:hypothetical protein
MALNRSLLCAAACLVAFDLANAAIDDEFVGLGSHMRVRTLLYSDGPLPTATIFLGEPVELVLTLRNNTKQPVVAGVGGRNWRDGVAISFERDTAPDENLTIEWTSPLTPSLRLAPTRSETAILAIRYRGRTELPTGRYRVRVALSSADFERVGPRFNDRLADELMFEVRAVQTLEEQIDHHLHLAYRAKLSGQLNRQEMELQEVLALNPASAVAHADLGMLWKNRSNCNRARAEYQRTIDTLTSRGDPGLRMDEMAREDWAAELSGLIRNCK